AADNARCGQPARLIANHTGYPGNLYQPGQQPCSWRIEADSPGYVVKLVVVNISIQYCNRLLLYDGEYSSDTGSMQLCQYQHWITYSTGKYLYLKYRVDGERLDPDRFHLQYSAVHYTEVPAQYSPMRCGSLSSPVPLQAEYRNPKFILSPLGHDFDFYKTQEDSKPDSHFRRKKSMPACRNAACRGRNEPRRYVLVALYVTRFRYGLIPDCQYDNFTVFDGDSVHRRVLATYCNNSSEGQTIFSSGPSMLVTYRSESGLDGRYFKLRYEAVLCSDAPSMATTPPNSDHHTSDTGAIVGGVLGGVALVGVVCCIVACRARGPGKTRFYIPGYARSLSAPAASQDGPDPYIRRMNLNALSWRDYAAPESTRTSRAATRPSHSSPRCSRSAATNPAYTTPESARTPRAAARPSHSSPRSSRGATNSAYTSSGAWSTRQSACTAGARAGSTGPQQASVGDPPPSYFSLQHDSSENTPQQQPVPPTSDTSSSAPPPYTDVMQAIYPPADPTQG
ncbi:hypothetical protein BaRGS_00001833, partial [Batillaria attramentaria]